MSNRSRRLVLGWVRLYTRGLPTEDSLRRRAELESDLWEQIHDPDEPGATGILGRCLRGMPADLWWRYRALTTTKEERRREMDRSMTWNWWVALTGLIALVGVVTGLGSVLAGAGGTTSAWAIAGLAGALVASGLMLGGLFRRSSDLVAGSWMILAGALLGGPFALPLAAVVVVSGAWTGNLVLSDGRRGEPRLIVARRQQHTLTRRWYLWLAVAAALFAFGLLFPLLVFSDDPNSITADEPGVLENLLGAIGWMAWWGSWLAAAVAGGVGALLGVAHLFLRRRPHLPTGGSSQQ